jgi:hypothetical protein
VLTFVLTFVLANIGASRVQTPQGAHKGAPYGLVALYRLTGHQIGAAPGELGVHRDIDSNPDQSFCVLVGVVSAEDQLAAFSEPNS